MSDSSGRHEKHSQSTCPFCKLNHPGGEDACWFKHPEKRPARSSRHLAPDSLPDGERSTKRNVETSTRNYGDTEFTIIREISPGGRKSPLPGFDDRDKAEWETQKRKRLLMVEEHIKMLEGKRRDIDMQLYQAKKEAEDLERQEYVSGGRGTEQMEAEMRRLHVTQSQREEAMYERESMIKRRRDDASSRKSSVRPEPREERRTDRTHGWREVQASGTPKADIVRPGPRR